MNVEVEQLLFKYYYIDTGCEIGGSFACLNGGICLTFIGSCFCFLPYSGPFCDICKKKCKIKKLLLFKYFYEDVGCVFGFFPCLNGGVCQNSSCIFPPSFNGITCGTYEPTTETTRTTTITTKKTTTTTIGIMSTITYRSTNTTKITTSKK
jgi:hypothetical protein